MSPEQIIKEVKNIIQKYLPKKDFRITDKEIFQSFKDTILRLKESLAEPEKPKRLFVAF